MGYHIDIANELLNVSGIQVNEQDIQGSTPLHLAAEFIYPDKAVSYLKIIDRLLSISDIDVFKKDNGGNTILHYLASINHPIAVELAKKVLPTFTGIQLNQKNNLGYSILHLATQHSDCSLVEELILVEEIDIEQKIDKNEPNNNNKGFNSFILAWKYDRTKIFELLKKQKAYKNDRIPRMLRIKKSLGLEVRY